MDNNSLTTEGQELGDVPTDSALTSKMEQQEKKLMKLQNVNQRLQQEIQEHMEEMEVVHTSLNQHIAARQLQLQEFGDMKEKYSWTVERILSLEKEKKEDFEQMEFVKQCLDEQVAACITLEKQLSERKSGDKKMEVLQHQLQEFDNMKEKYSWSVKHIESLEKDLEQAKEMSVRNETEHNEACEKLTELQLLQKEVFEENLEEMDFVKRVLDKTLEQRSPEKESDRKKIKVLERQLQEFEDMKEKYSWTVERNLSLEKEKKEDFEQMEFVQKCLDEQVAACITLEKQLSERKSGDKKIEVLQHQLQEFDDMKEKYSWSVKHIESLEKDLSERQSGDKKIEVLKRQLQEFEEVKEQYSWSLKKNESLEKELEQAKESLASNETERKETCEKLTELQQRQKKVLTKNFEKLRFVKQCLEEQVSARKTLEQEIREKGSESKKIEVLQLQLQEFEDIKEEYSWSVNQNQSLEIELEQTKQNLGNTEQDLKEERRKREIESEKWEMETRELERELQLCQSRLKQMEDDKEIQNKPSTCETQTQTDVTMQQLDSAKLEMENMEEVRHSLEKSLHEKEVEFESERRRLTEELEQACDKLEQQKTSQKTFLQEHLEELRVFKEFVKDQVAIRKGLEKQISEISNQKNTLTCEMQTQTVEQLEMSEDLDTRETSEDQPLDKTLEQRFTEKESDRKKIEVLERQLQEFEEVKEKYSWSVKHIESLEKDLEQAKEMSVRTETEHNEACEKLTELQLLQKEVFEENLEEMEFVKRSLEKQVATCKTLEQKFTPKEKECKKIEVLERQLQEFEEVKEQYSWSLKRNESLEKELEQAKESLASNETERKETCEKLTELQQRQKKVLTKNFEKLRFVKRALDEQVSARKTLEQEIREKGSESKKIEILQLQMENMEEVRHSLEKSLHEKEVEFESERRRLTEELEQACDKLEQQKTSQKTFLQEHLEDLRVFKEFVKDQVAVRKDLEKQISEISNQKKTSTCEMQTQTVKQTKLEISEDLDTRETSEDQPALDTEGSFSDELEKLEQTSNVRTQHLVQRTVAVFEKAQVSADRPKPQSSEKECRELQGNVNNLTLIFKEKQEQQKQGSCLRRDGVKGKNVAALMKMFEQ